MCSGNLAQFLAMNNIPCDTAALGELAAYLSALNAIPGALNLASLPPELLTLITTPGGTDPLAPPPPGSIGDQILSAIGGIPGPGQPGGPPPVTGVPEPGTALLLMAGLAGLATTRRPRRGR